MGQALEQFRRMPLLTTLFKPQEGLLCDARFHLALREKGIRSLLIHHDHLTRRLVRCLGALPLGELHLDIRASSRVRVALKGLAKVKSLRGLYLSSYYLHDWHLSSLESLKQLRVLVLNSRRLTDRTMARLSGLNRLEFLRVTSPRITNRGLRHIVGLKRLRFLSLRGRDLSDRGLAALRHLDALRHLRFRNTRVSNYGLPLLLPMGKLRTLDLGGTWVTDAGTAILGRLDNLRMLSLARTSLSDAGLSSLSRLAKLRALNLSGTKTSDVGLAWLAGMKALERLELAETRVTGAGLARLSALKGLRHLNLYRTRITDADLVHIGGMKGLVHLNLGRTRITDAGLAHLSEMKRLKYINLYRTAISNRSLPFFLGHRTLRRTRIHGDGLFQSASAQISQVVQNRVGGFLRAAERLPSIQPRVTDLLLWAARRPFRTELIWKRIKTLFRREGDRTTREAGKGKHAFRIQADCPNPVGIRQIRVKVHPGPERVFSRMEIRFCKPNRRDLNHLARHLAHRLQGQCRKKNSFACLLPQSCLRVSRSGIGLAHRSSGACGNVRYALGVVVPEGLDRPTLRPGEQVRILQQASRVADPHQRARFLAYSLGKAGWPRVFYNENVRKALRAFGEDMNYSESRRADKVLDGTMPVLFMMGCAGVFSMMAYTAGKKKSRFLARHCPSGGPRLIKPEIAAAMKQEAVWLVLSMLWDARRRGLANNRLHRLAVRGVMKWWKHRRR